MLVTIMVLLIFAIFPVLITAETEKYAKKLKIINRIHVCDLGLKKCGLGGNLEKFVSHWHVICLLFNDTYSFYFSSYLYPKIRGFDHSFAFRFR